MSRNRRALFALFTLGFLLWGAPRAGADPGGGPIIISAQDRELALSTAAFSVAPASAPAVVSAPAAVTAAPAPAVNPVSAAPPPITNARDVPAKMAPQPVAPRRKSWWLFWWPWAS